MYSETGNSDTAFKSLYENKKVISEFARCKTLQKPEQTILSLLKSKLTNMSMLDLGVGAGRTTYSFYPMTKEYIGLDYSKGMIEVCKQRFPLVKFYEMDCRDLSAFEPEKFDFVLFSCNGLDHFGLQDRLKTLSEVKRIMKKNGYFCFSSHNLNWAPKYLIFDIRDDLKCYLLRRELNKNLKKNMRSKDFLPVHCVRNIENSIVYYDSYHIRPPFALRQLLDTGFKNISVFGLDGKEKTTDEIKKIEDPWLYYLCEKS